MDLDINGKAECASVTMDLDRHGEHLEAQVDAIFSSLGGLGDFQHRSEETTKSQISRCLFFSG